MAARRETMASPCCSRRRGCRAAVPAVALLLGAAARGVGATSAGDGAVLLRFGNVTNNNLAGKGPESEKKQAIIWSDAADLGDEVIDVIAFVSGDPGSYTSSEASRNGHRGDFGVVNLAMGSTADLTLRIFDDASATFVSDAEMYLTIHDIDSISAEMKEVITVSGFQSYCGSDDSEVEFSQTEDGVQLTSSSVGTDDDDPASPYDMTPGQLRRSVTFTLGKVSQFPVRFEIPGPKGGGGRDFIFSGVPMECAVKKRWRCEDDLALAEKWPKVQQEWCCKAKQLGCNSSTGKGSSPADNEFDCRSDPRKWSRGEQEWCCKHQKRGCNVQVDPYDCEEGLWNWKHEWSDEKRGWCCEHEGVGCLEEEVKSPQPETYDCQPGNVNPVRRWSEQKRQWCCEHVGHGCLAANPQALEGLPPVAHCEGRETHWVECENQPTCPACVPKDCIFSEWDEWTVGEGCTGLCERRRAVSRASNECGKPCEGTRVQTVARDECYTQECGDLRSKDCQWGVWEDWSECSNEVDQSYRKRVIAIPPSVSGIACEGEWNQTKACGDNSRTADCELSEWGNWTECTKSCGGGWRAQMRRIAKRAGHGGKPCSGVVRRTAVCNPEPCPQGGPRCELSEWEEWSGCRPHQGVLQQTRDRVVERVNQDAGGESFCNHDLQETRACSEQPDVAFACALEDWSEWSDCSAACSGFTHRSRKGVDEWHSEKCFLGEGLAVLNETAPCGPKCVAGIICALSEWSEWSKCSQSCGSGLSERSRSVLEERSCSAVLKETRECSAEPCEPIDCEWGDWEDWSRCSTTCGGGNKRRQRYVAVLPKNNGTVCDVATKSEVEACHTQNCTPCIDGKWASWGDWSECTASCAPAYRNRHRDLERQANLCGKPASGLGDEFETCKDLLNCSALQESRDCKLSDWGDWSDCSASCGGVRNRYRTVVEGALGLGRPCQGDLQLVGACPPNPACYPKGAVNCSMADWADWTECSASCDGGQRKRTRNITGMAQRGGEGCYNETTVTVEACGTDPCDPECGPCAWEDWSDWGACVKDVPKCSSQRYRERKVLTQPGKCGRTCPHGTLKEASNCSLPCDAGTQSYCVWSDWSDVGECQGSCEFATKSRTRKLRVVRYKELDLELEGGEPKEAVLFKMAGNEPCNGTQMDSAVCSQDTCGSELGPADCEFDPWSRWSDPTCTHLCQRHRGIARPNDEGGEPCRGPIVEAKPCKHDCNDPGADPEDCYFSDFNCSLAIDCLFSDWTGWSDCKSKADQSYRNRTVLQESRRGGKECEGPLEETHSCVDPDAELVDCRIGDWLSWSECSRTCGGGVHERSREVAVQPLNGGASCSGPLKQAHTCSTQPCSYSGEQDRPCELTDWADWGGCSDDGTKVRHRELEHDARGNGVRCNAAVKETARCEGPQDCQMTEWQDWEACDKSCAGGQQQRKRQIKVAPREGGAECPADVVVLRGCNQIPCSEDDAQVSEWSPWSECSKDCGGERTRQRSVSHPPRSGGSAFYGALAETEPCKTRKGPHACADCTECAWAEWSEWSGCDRDCGGGQQSRERDVQTPPSAGCPPCEPLDKQELRSCNTLPCGLDAGTECIDGRWGPWTPWSPCSATCSGGVTSRSRDVEVKANQCGRPVEGRSMEHAGCNDHIACRTDRDCEFADWSSWTACEEPCHGRKQRGRQIRVEGAGDGASCDGPLGQTAPCRESTECQGVGAAKVKDCELSGWSPWGMCSARCGAGQKSRSRDIVTEGTLGGRWCNGDLRETAGCNASKPCEEEDECTPTDCRWSDWGDWSACDHDERRRERHIIAYPKCGGKGCNRTTAMEIAECTFLYHGETFCVWGDWSKFTECSTTCGSGLRSRQRHLLLALRANGTAGANGTEAFTRLFSSSDFELAWREEAERDPAALADGVRQLRLLEERTRAVEGRRAWELAASWAAGALSLVAIGTAVVGARSRGRAFGEGGQLVPSEVTPN